MLESPTENVSAEPTPDGTAVGRERLLGIPDISEITGLSEATASKLMKESGRAIRLHSRLYLLESSFYAWLRELEARGA